MSAVSAPQVRLEYDRELPQVVFAAEEIGRTLEGLGYTLVPQTADAQITLAIDPESLRPQCYRIRHRRPGALEISGGDAAGAMYGGLQVAESLRLEKDIAAVPDSDGRPFIAHRGLKLNVPLDARSPSYDDTGDAAQKNIVEMWNFEFWREFLDEMARHRYNLLTLWTCHPYPTLIKLAEYPDIAFDDVCVLKAPFDHQTDKHWTGIDLQDPGNLRIVKRITIDEKIDYWRRVMQHAADRGIDIYVFHWNIHTFGAEGKYGITNAQDNANTVKYLRACVKELLLTYPLIKGIGVTAGERVNRKLKGEYGIENWVWKTYGMGIMDAKAVQPDRHVRFIFRRHWSDLGDILEAFRDYRDDFATSMKYARARIYTTPSPPFFDMWYRDECQRNNVKCWMNLRNDDIFCHRWGDPEHVRKFLINLPHDLLGGFYMGSDGYVWGREFTSLDPEQPRQLEIRKHWYRFMLWGRLAYDPTLDRAFFESVLADRFPETDTSVLYDAWAAASGIVPQVNRFHWHQNDVQWAPEACFDMRNGFHDVNRLIGHSPQARSGILPIEEYVEALQAGEEPQGVTPMQVADNLDRFAEQALAGAASVGKRGVRSKELRRTLTDIESMAQLGRYYADKIRGATELAISRATEDESRQKRAIEHLERAVEHWEAYAKLASSQYKPQLLARTRVLDWREILEHVKRDVAIAEGNTP